MVDSFIGSMTPTRKGGILTIVGVRDVINGIKVYDVVCSICSKDKELFPYYFKSTKVNFYKSCPCGCSKYPRLSESQAIVKIKRICEYKDYMFDCFISGYKTNRSKFKYVCPFHGYQTVSYDSFVNRGTGCSSCFGNKKNNTNEATQILIDLCNQSGYEFVGFVDEHKNSYSDFKYICPEHGYQTVQYYSFVNNRSRCPYCNGGMGYQKDKSGTFYIVKWTNEFGISWFKFGITGECNPENRMKNQVYVHRKHTGEILKYDIRFMYSWVDGKIPLSLENEFKKIQRHIGIFCNKTMMVNGFTETISIFNVDEINKCIKSNLKIDVDISSEVYIDLTNLNKVVE